ncbi:MAG TPA: hypothetical protein VN240_10555 [Propylenella sp.]|nr:hypothetical protein [Propylenella sp.]
MSLAIPEMGRKLGLEAVRAVADSGPRQISARSIGDAADHRNSVNPNLDVQAPVRRRRVECPSVDAAALDALHAALQPMPGAKATDACGK